VTHNWIQRNIFHEIPYWKTNLFLHNLDFVYLKKKLFENIFNTVMDMKGKTKDDMKVRMNISLFCHHKNIEFIYYGSQSPKPVSHWTIMHITCLSIAQESVFS
jgi:hypothetical protein